MARELHRIARRASARSRLDLPPLLFVHGGYTHSACWDVNFLRDFQKRGHDVFALDLSGHGQSAGKANLHDFGLDDYAADVQQIIATLDSPPVLIGHSMGAIVVQRCVEEAGSAAAGIVMLSPVPPTGLAASAMQLAIRQPDFLSEAQRAIRGEFSEKTIRVMREVYFSPDADMLEFTQFQPLLQDESMRAVSELMTLAMRLPTKTRLPQLPALVIGGELDALFPASRLHFTAAGWNAPVVVIPRAGHMLMLDPQWPQVAGTIADWLQREFVVESAILT